ncbi:hypothetical protein Ocin01_16895 [Orchesella cincta]|uniref:Death domain-containing protein n=1 Tax=Orchesella cincta TaxID=48709 RepID=A0A1D2M9X8_ORCCI|nr:hypothetical protein Ocin01_16895 [Orchesella cincta]
MAQAQTGIDRMDVGNQLLLGDQDCPYEDIMDAIEGSASPGILYSKWKDFGRRLNTPDDTMTTLELNIGKPGNTYRNAISTILKESNGKPLSDVISALRKCNVNDIADAVTNKFSLR